MSDITLIGCKDGITTITNTGQLKCSGQFVPVTVDQVKPNNGLTLSEANQLLEPTLYIFATVFVFLLIKKILT